MLDFKPLLLHIIHLVTEVVNVPRHVRVFHNDLTHDLLHCVMIIYELRLYVVTNFFSRERRKLCVDNIILYVTEISWYSIGLNMHQVLILNYCI